MTEPTAPRPVPGPYRPGSAPVAVPGAPPAGPRPDDPSSAAGGSPSPVGGAGRLDGLDELPVSEHVALFEAEHARLQGELGTIDPR
ncbi:hypothetical protein E9549_14440 [Blastococcus sp. MG754426]|uniref:hypothetical protein n=1 Tax=unclassified Blastococcus TaxID=2619396 RepID=UPI001EF00284|nr:MULTISPECIES: hypothetical protein [unclassified Blastococcus]MCF6508595.1 hypothetical protein [Blastococcus sp. MG754426]MCF6513173.1 hypothetical protein [Blastococcus sp. MG754427]